MKKNIIPLAALFVTCFTNLFAQNGSTINADASKSFQEKFSSAVNVVWESQARGISLAKFNYKSEAWIAYFGPEGDLITSGRKIKSVDQLPVKVRESLDRSQRKYAAKYGTFTFGSIFEMVNTESGTAYFIPMESADASIMLSISGGGSLSLRRKELHPSPLWQDPSTIAKKN